MRLIHRIVIMILSTVVLTTTGAQAAPGDENWDTNWALPGTDGEVHAVLEFNGDLVIVGRFTQVGDVAASGVAIYDGAGWSPMGAGLLGFPTTAAIFNSELYVGGGFTLADGTPSGGIARWSGTAWMPAVGGGTDAEVSDMAVYGNELVICGDFSTVGGGTFAGGIAGWNGTTWNTYDGGSESIFSVAADATYLYATGYFEGIGSAFASNVARWNGTSWSAMGSGLTDEFGDPFEGTGEFIHTWAGNVVVTGTFTHAGGQALANFAVWNGASWGTLGGDPDFFLDGAWTIGEYAGDLLVYNGFTHVNIWNGIFWNAAVNGGQFTCMGQYGSAMVFGGSFSELNGLQVKNIGMWDGTTASALATGDGVDGPVDGIHEWNGQMVVSGSGLTRFGNVVGELVAAWDGNQWNSLGAGLHGTTASYLYGMDTHQGDLVVSGPFTSAGGSPIAYYARWDGTSWSQISDGAGLGGGEIEVVGSELFAVVHDGGTNVARLNDLTNTWEYIGAITPGFTLSKLGQYNGQIVAAGSFPAIDGVTAQGIAVWNGNTWAPLGAGIVGSVNGMDELDGKLYVAGVFSMAGGSPAVHAAVWDGVDWSPLGSGLGNRAFDLEAFDGEVFVTGEMTTAGGVPASYVARWDGAAWNAMGSGLSDIGQDLATVGGKLFVGGDFTSAGGHHSAGIAGWSAGVSAVGPFPGNTLALAPGTPNPFTNDTTFFFDLKAPGDVRVDIFDVRGHRVSRRVLGGLGIGQHSFSWDGRDNRGRRAANGTYFVQVRTATVEGMRRVTVLR